MMRSAIIFLLVNYCAFLFSQNVQYTRIYDTDAKLVPVKIINNHPDFFYVLRYNKIGHDFTIERRRKPSGIVAAFTVLKLDSVNAKWFDFENLDYLFFEHNYHLYFVFEKVLNSRRAIYIKTIDTTGHSTGFKELAFLESTKATSDFRFNFKVTGKNKLLVVGAQTFVNGTAKKLALLYDLEKRENIWFKPLPMENVATGYSEVFEVNSQNDLFYLSVTYGVVDDGLYHSRAVQPGILYNDLSVGLLRHDEEIPSSRRLHLGEGITGLKSLLLQPDDQRMLVMAHVTEADTSGNERTFFFTGSFGANLNEPLYRTSEPLDESLRGRLTFYDGPDNRPEGRQYQVEGCLDDEGYNYLLAGRRDKSYYKELLLRKTNLRNGHIISQEIIPRKIFYFEGRTRFKHIGTTAQMTNKGSWYCFLLEHDKNLKKQPRDFNFHKFREQDYLDGGNLVAYILRPDGNLEKKAIYRNEVFSYVPISYSSNQSDFVFYLNNVIKEKFAILKLGTF